MENIMRWIIIMLAKSKMRSLTYPVSQLLDISKKKCPSRSRTQKRVWRKESQFDNHELEIMEHAWITKKSTFDDLRITKQAFGHDFFGHGDNG